MIVYSILLLNGMGLVEIIYPFFARYGVVFWYRRLCDCEEVRGRRGIGLSVLSAVV